MLSYFSVKNFKNFKDNLIFDLSKTNNYEFNKECIQNDIVNKAIIYGHNGCGKSNLGFAIFDIILHLTDNTKILNCYQNYLNAENNDKIAEFHYKFKFDDNYLEYIYGKESFEDLVYEKVLINNEIVIAYDRKNDKEAIINLEGAETLNKDLSGSKISIVKYIKTNTVLVKNEKNRVLNRFFLFVENMLFTKDLDDRYYQGYQTGTIEIIKDIIERNNVEDFNNFLKEAGIQCSLKADVVNDTKKLFFIFGEKQIDFSTAASSGTLSLAAFYTWLQRIKFDSNKPSFLFMDEFDAFYHLSLSELVIKELKKNNCQVILTSHNTSLMNNELMRPDCCFILYNNKITSLTKLTDKELRYAHNIEKMYRAGAFNE